MRTRSIPKWNRIPLTDAEQYTVISTSEFIRVGERQIAWSEIDGMQEVGNGRLSLSHRGEWLVSISPAIEDFDGLLDEILQRAPLVASQTKFVPPWAWLALIGYLALIVCAIAYGIYAGSGLAWVFAILTMCVVLRDAFNTPLRIEVQREAIRLRTLFRHAFTCCFAAAKVCR
ncbi:MAG: hypothetical protein ACTHQM_18520 [Thermoanaerobaculia bacterium]